jgi:hypothetical protein
MSVSRFKIEESPGEFSARDVTIFQNFPRDLKSMISDFGSMVILVDFLNHYLIQKERMNE